MTAERHMAAALLLRDVFFFPAGAGLVRGAVVVGADGHVVWRAAADGRDGRDEGAPLLEVRGEGRLVVLPALRNAYLHVPPSSGGASAPTAAAGVVNGHGQHDAHRASAVALRALLAASLRAGVTEVHVDAPALSAAEVEGEVAGVVPAVVVRAVNKRPADVVCLRADRAAAAATAAGLIGTGSTAKASPSVWDELRALLVAGRLDEQAALAAASATRPGDLVVIYADDTWAALDDYDLRDVLMRVQDSDVCGVLVNGRLEYTKQALAERVFTVNPATHTHGAEAGAHKSSSKAPADVPQEAERSDSCEFDTVEDALADIAAGKFVVVVDNEDRENEGDLIIAAEFMTAEKMAFMIRFCSGLICMSVLPGRLEELQLPLMVTANDETFQTAFTVSIDYKHGTTTGISAADRAATARAVTDPNVKPQDFARPGHMFPLRYANGGTLTRMGHTEATIDLCKMAKVYPCGVLCEIALDDGTMARRDYLRAFSRHHGFKMITIADIIRHRRANSLLEL